MQLGVMAAEISGGNLAVAMAYIAASSYQWHLIGAYLADNVNGYRLMQPAKAVAHIRLWRWR